MNEYGITSIILKIIIVPLLIIGSLLNLIYKGLKILFIDVLKNIYMKFVAVATLVVISLIISGFGM